MASEEGSIISKRFKRLFHSPNLGGCHWRSIPSDKGGPSHPDREIRGGPASKKFFSALWASFWSKNEGGPGPRAPPLDPPLTSGGSRPSEKGGGRSSRTGDVGGGPGLPKIFFGPLGLILVWIHDWM